ncbi:hypothetical protein ACJJTC_000307 [Scirpophaga incertulas]
MELSGKLRWNLKINGAVFTIIVAFIRERLVSPLSDAGTALSSSERVPRELPADAADLVRDAPLYPPLQDTRQEIDLLDTLDNEPFYNDLETSIEENQILVTPEDLTISINSTETDQVTNVQNGDDEVETTFSDSEERSKRSSGQEWEKTAKSGERRVKTGDTILNIRGAVRDAIGDAGAAPPPAPRASSQVGAFVIRPAPAPAPDPRQQNLQTSPTNITRRVPKNENELLVEAHAKAVIPCDLVNVTNIRWYKDNDQMQVPEGDGEGLSRSGGSLVVWRASRADAGAWRCAGDKAGRLLTGKPTRLLIYEAVRAVYLAVDGRRLDAGNTWVPVRDKAVLEVRCVAEGGVPAPDLTWKLVASDPSLDHRPYLRIHSTNYSVEGVSTSSAAVVAARGLHNASLHCVARQPSAASIVASTPLTAKLTIHVTYPPSFVISRWPGFGVALSAGAAAALRCDVDANPPARATWVKDDPPATSPPALAGEEDGSATLRWSALGAEHAGWYRCRASWLHTEYSSIGYYLNVVPEEQTQSPTEAAEDEEEAAATDHQRVEVPLGGHVQLHCPKGSVGCWWRRVLGNTSESWAPAGSHRAHGVLGIKDALYQEGGEYRCVGARAPDLRRLKELKRVTLKVTGGATATALSAEPARGGWRLECGACGRNLRVRWLRLRSGVPLAALPADLRPDLAQHCWRAVLHVKEPDEVWCVAATSESGAVAVFPKRTMPGPSPEPARRALHAGTKANSARILLAILMPMLGALFCR